jgi:hypothetical protein
MMALLKMIRLKAGRQPPEAQTNDWRSRGAISVEYALCMVLAGILMLGVERLFRNMAIDVLNHFIGMVSQFPNI